jgi:hypothetical protein
LSESLSCSPRSNKFCKKCTPKIVGLLKAERVRVERLLCFAPSRPVREYWAAYLQGIERVRTEFFALLRAGEIE